MDTTLTDAICPAPRILGWFDVGTRVTFLPAGDGPVVRIEGCYLDANELDGPVSLGDGVEMMFHHLEEPLPEGDPLLAMCEAVTAGLAGSTWTAVEVPGERGILLVELAPWQLMPGAPGDDL